MRRNTTAPSEIGNQPPSAIFTSADEKNAASTIMKEPVAAMHSASG